MSNIKVLPDTIKEFYNILDQENDKILSLVSDIEKTTIEYQDMMVSKAGRLFNEYMLQEQLKMKNIINNNKSEVLEKYLLSSIEYSDVITDIRRSIE